MVERLEVTRVQGRGGQMDVGEALRSPQEGSRWVGNVPHLNRDV